MRSLPLGGGVVAVLGGGLVPIFTSQNRSTFGFRVDPKTTHF